MHLGHLLGVGADVNRAALDQVALGIVDRELHAVAAAEAVAGQQGGCADVALLVEVRGAVVGLGGGNRGERQLVGHDGEGTLVGNGDAVLAGIVACGLGLDVIAADVGHGAECTSALVEDGQPHGNGIAALQAADAVVIRGIGGGDGEGMRAAVVGQGLVLDGDRHGRDGRAGNRQGADLERGVLVIAGQDVAVGIAHGEDIRPGGVGAAQRIDIDVIGSGVDRLGDRDAVLRQVIAAHDAVAILAIGAHVVGLAVISLGDVVAGDRQRRGGGALDGEGGAETAVGELDADTVLAFGEAVEVSGRQGDDGAAAHGGVVVDREGVVIHLNLTGKLAELAVDAEGQTLGGVLRPGLGGIAVKRAIGDGRGDGQGAGDNAHGVLVRM